eukprot:CAMPEP_0169231938 /NCGR_PEP_ID=MMETSP1016-20121227/26790_1 /TAXON_ID=342587 /ORGANISM="Karlodinium micrum, Strain CCMP2283" /LENGTH=416 /DNA_ID=CAMNT_0009311129 /DNA_START=691 /DNA_END=1939 /DNA_ORIENTATION=+
MTKCSSSSSQPFLARGAAKIRSERGVARKLGGKKRTFQESHIRQPTVTKQSRVAKTQLHSRELWAARQLATGARGGVSVASLFEDDGKLPVPRGVARIRGIVQSAHGTCSGYYAHVTFAYLQLRGRWHQHLSDAIDDHSVLVAAKLRVLLRVEEDSGVLQPEHPIREALLQIHQEGVSCRVSVSMPNRYAHYLVGRALNSPTYNTSSVVDIDAAVCAWRQFRLASETGSQPPSTGGRGTGFRAPPGSEEILQKWLKIRSAYLDLWRQRGADVESLAAKLDGLLAACAPHRERDWELHERAAMAREEKRQRAAELGAAHRQEQKILLQLTALVNNWTDAIVLKGLLAACAPHRERDWELHERAAMAREEKRQRAAELGAAHRQEQKILLQLTALVNNWTDAISAERPSGCLRSSPRA